MSIGRPDLSQVVASLNCFGTAPCDGHLKLALWAFGFIKQTQLIQDNQSGSFYASTLVLPSH